jgi:hypothetical protein
MALPIRRSAGARALAMTTHRRSIHVDAAKAVKQLIGVALIAVGLLISFAALVLHWLVVPALGLLSGGLYLVSTPNPGTERDRHLNIVYQQARRPRRRPLYRLPSERNR